MLSIQVVGGGVGWALVDEPRPDVPDGWSLVRVDVAGLCGSDLSAISEAAAAGRGGSWALGHEVVGHVIDGNEVAGRVVVHPLVTCAARARPPCRSCTHGALGECLEFWFPSDPSRGKSIGFPNGPGGGLADYLAVPNEMLRPVPAGMASERAVLAEPLSVVLAGLRRLPGRSREWAVVVGAGTLGLLAAFAIRRQHPRSRVTVVARHGFQADAARVLLEREDAATSGDPVTALAELVPELARPDPRASMLIEGPDLVVDAGGSASSFTTALAVAGMGASVLSLGNVDACPDLRPLWLKGLTVSGHLEHGGDGPSGGGDSLTEALDHLVDADGIDELLVRHRYPLHAFDRALTTARSKTAEQAIKVVLTPTLDHPRGPAPAPDRS